MENKHCFARTDPRMGTFDGVSWTALLAGEFVMYRDIRRQIAVSKKKKNIFKSCLEYSKHIRSVFVH